MKIVLVNEWTSMEVEWIANGDLADYPRGGRIDFDGRTWEVTKIIRFTNSRADVWIMEVPA